MKLGDLPDEPLEGHLPDEQLGALLILANFTGKKINVRFRFSCELWHGYLHENYSHTIELIAKQP